MKTGKNPRLVKAPPLFPGETKKHAIIVFFVCLAGFLLFFHYDLRETAAHATVFLQSLFRGEVRSFYGDVIAHQNPYGYLNNAHYNVALYALFSLAELPLFLLYQAFGALPPEVLISFAAKLVCAAFFAGCTALMPMLGRQAGLGEKDAAYAALFFALWPPAFFSAFAMGQYDVISLFLILAGFLCWSQGWLPAFSLFFGAAFATKLFPVFLFIPLLLLREKRPLRLLLSGLLSLWLLAPTTLMYHGLTFDAAVFNAGMTQRLFATKLSGGREIPLFLLVFGFLCIVCWFWRPEKARLMPCGLWLGLAVFGSLFFFLDWHPQWLILLAPFAVLTTLLEKQRTPWFFLDLLLCLGFFLVSFAAFPGQLEGNLLDFGLFGQFSGFLYSRPPLFARLCEALPLLAYLPTGVFNAALAAGILLKLPLATGTPAARLTGQGPFLALAPQKELPVFLWLVFGLGFGLFWLLPTLLGILF